MLTSCKAWQGERPFGRSKRNCPGNSRGSFIFEGDHMTNKIMDELIRRAAGHVSGADIGKDANPGKPPGNPPIIPIGNAGAGTEQGMPIDKTNMNFLIRYIWRHVK
jgi:hypothetical protein